MSPQSRLRRALNRLLFPLLLGAVQGLILEAVPGSSEAFKAVRRAPEAAFGASPGVSEAHKKSPPKIKEVVRLAETLNQSGTHRDPEEPGEGNKRSP